MNEFFFITFHKNIFFKFICGQTYYTLSGQIYFFLVFLLKNMMHLSFIHIHVEARINSIKFRKLYQKKINVLITCKTKSYR